jgi:transcriptional regulator with XRE-family HTH domain
MNLGKAIKLLLDKKGMSQKELAELIDKSETSVSLIMQNKTQPRKDTLEAIAKKLGVTTEVLLLLSVDKEDLPEEKRIQYDALWPTVEHALMLLFADPKQSTKPS